MRGLVTRSQSGFYSVEAEAGAYTCRLRGRMKRGPREGDLIAVGDWVEFTPLSQDKGAIEKVEPREHMLSRMAPTPRGEYQQIIIANPDQAVLVFSCAQPRPRFGMLDRFLVITAKQGIPELIVANKVDLVGMDEAQELFGIYTQIGYPVVYCSARSEQGIDELRDHLGAKISVLVGPSGVGKTSLLNKVQTGLGLAVREVSEATSKGRHTTVVRQLFPLEMGGYVADTPGLKALALWDVDPAELDGYFPELRHLVSGCQFSDCTHVHEPGCAVQEAVARGEVSSRRYDSYVRMREGQEEEFIY